MQSTLQRKTRRRSSITQNLAFLRGGRLIHTKIIPAERLFSIASSESIFLKEVLAELSQDELEKLFQKVTEMKKPSTVEEKSVLSKFNEAFQNSEADQTLHCKLRFQKKSKS